MAGKFPTPLELAGSPQRLNIPRSNLLSNIQTNVQELLDKPSPESLELAENLISSSVEIIPPSAQPAAQALLQSIRDTRAKTPKQRNIEKLLSGPKALSTPGRSTELETAPGAVRVGDDPRSLESFQLPEGTLGPGEREAGRIVSSQGDFARALIERVNTREKGVKFSAQELLIRRSRLEEAGVKESTIKKFEAIHAPSGLDKFDEIIAQLEPNRGKFDLYSERTKAALITSGVSAKDIETIQFESILQAKSRQKLKDALDLEVQVRQGAGGKAVAPSELKRYVNPTSLKVAPIGTTVNQLREATESGLLIGLTSVTELNDINKVPAALEILKELRQLAKDNPDIFPSVKLKGQAVALGIVGFNRVKQFLGAAAVNPVFSKLQAMQIALVPLIKAFGDTGNIAVKEAERAMEAIGLRSTSVESLVVNLDLIFKGLAAGVRARKVNPQFLIDAEKVLLAPTSKRPTVASKTITTARGSVIER